MLDLVHGLVLRSVARGDDDAGDDVPALRTLVATGLVARLPGGGVAVTEAGRVALAADEEDPIGTSPEAPWILAGLLAFVAAMFVVTNLIGGRPLLTGLQISALVFVGLSLGLGVAYLRRAQRPRRRGARTRTFN